MDGRLRNPVVIAAVAPHVAHTNRFSILREPDHWQALATGPEARRARSLKLLHSRQELAKGNIYREKLALSTVVRSSREPEGCILSQDDSQ